MMLQCYFPLRLRWGGSKWGALMSNTEFEFELPIANVDKAAFVNVAL